MITKIRERTHKELKYLNTIEKELEEIENKKSKESVQEILGQIREVQEIKHKVVLLKRRIDSGTYRFVELWVLGNTMLSIALFTVCSAPGLQWWELICIVYGAFQVFGIFVYQINVLFFDPLKGRGTYVLGGYTRIVILLIHNYV
ncbi:MAG: hypothetical protein M3044_10885, partial [Thermoproteota archaeon]|nr:hypothetical protein [Thermoproteota archaeon]